MQEGDLVTRKSYRGDVVFKIEEIYQQKAVLKGVEYRLLADSPLSDLDTAGDQALRQAGKISSLTASEASRLKALAEALRDKQPPAKNETPFFDLPGKILHLDGDPLYLRKSMSVYGHLRIPAEGHYVPEASMPEALISLLPSVQPDILVITGHDGILKDLRVRGKMSLGSYKNSNNFVQAVRIARQYEKNRDNLTVIAGACQSHFEALLQAGANFASSPARILIHALDPVYIAAKASYTSIKETINIYDVIRHTMSGMEGVGGLETRGSFRRGLPRLAEQK